MFVFYSMQVLQIHQISSFLEMENIQIHFLFISNNLEKWWKYCQTHPSLARPTPRWLPTPFKSLRFFEPTPTKWLRKDPVDTG